MSISPIEAHLGYWLRFVSNHVSYAFARKVEARGVTVAEWVVLRELFDVRSQSPSVLADRLGLTRGAISKLADRLIAKGLIERKSGTTDRRTQGLNLTEAGRALVPDLSALADQNDAEFFGDLAPVQRKALEALMKDIIRVKALKTLPLE